MSQSCENDGNHLATFDTQEQVDELFELCLIANNYVPWGCYLGFHDLDYNTEFSFVDDDAILDPNAPWVWESEWGNGPGQLCGVIYTWAPAPPRVIGDGQCVGFQVYGICEGSPATIICRGT